jgi:hypothetical protein
LYQVVKVPSAPLPRGSVTAVLLPSITVKVPTVPVVLPGTTETTNYQPLVSNEYNQAGFKTGTVSANKNAKGTKQQTNITRY